MARASSLQHQQSAILIGRIKYFSSGKLHLLSTQSNGFFFPCSPNFKKSGITQTKDILNVPAGRYFSFLNLKGVFGLFSFPTPPTYCFHNLLETNKQANRTVYIPYRTHSPRERKQQQSFNLSCIEHMLHFCLLFLDPRIVITLLVEVRVQTVESSATFCPGGEKKALNRHCGRE